MKSLLRSPFPGVPLRTPGFPSLIAYCLLCVTLVVVPASAQKVAKPRIGGTVVIAGASDLQSMNSLVNSDAWTNEFIRSAMFVPLIRFRPDLSYAPALAESWRMIGDTVVIFRLRRDVRWHDGALTNAYDVAFTFDRVKDEATAFPNTEFFEKWQSALVVDSFTVRFRIKPHVEPLIGWAMTPIMPRHLLDSIPAARMRQAAFNKHPVGNGPFRFVSEKSNDRWVFEANLAFPRALGGRPRLDRLIWRVIPDNNAQAAAITTGEVDIANAIRAEQVKQLTKRSDMRAILRPSLRYAIITWNAKRAPLGDARVRRALTMALNRQQMITVLRGGYAQIATSPVPPSHWAYDKTLPPLAYDPAAAKQLLAAAGYVDRDRDGMVESSAGKPFEIELKVAANNPFNRDLGEMVRANLAAIGVKAAVRPTDFPVIIQDISSPNRNFDGAFLQFSSDFRLGLTDAFHSKAIDGPFQSASYSNAEVDRLLDRASAATDRAEAARIWKRVQRILRDEQPWTFLWWSPDMIVARDRVKGAEMDVRGALLNVQQWWVASR